MKASPVREEVGVGEGDGLGVGVGLGDGLGVGEGALGAGVGLGDVTPSHPTSSIVRATPAKLLICMRPNPLFVPPMIGERRFRYKCVDRKRIGEP
jgi:hypothetical protein